MKDGMRSMVWTRPLTKPMAVPAAMAASTAHQP